jgi:magnesium-transporting ATPase (P-type)
MAKSERQKKLSKKAILFGVLSYGILFALVLVYMISAVVLVKTKPDTDTIQIFTDEVKKAIIAMSATAVIGIILSFFLKEGVRTFLWIVCVILGSLVYKEIGMYIALGCWLVDDYVIHKLYKYFKTKLIIRKEIDCE